MAYNLQPEEIYFRKHVRHEAPISEAEDELWVKVGRAYVSQKPKPEDFNYAGVEELIAEDRAKLREKTSRPGFHEAHERSGLLEAMLWQYIEQENWFGENVFTVPASEPDEKLRGADFVIEAVNEDGTVSRMGVDVVLANSPQEVAKKCQELTHFSQRAAADPKVLELRYFRSEAEPSASGRIAMPRIILGMDQDHFSDLVAVAIKGGDALENHPVRELLREELRLCLLRLAAMPPAFRKVFSNDINGFMRLVRQFPAGNIPEAVAHDNVLQTLSVSIKRRAS